MRIPKTLTVKQTTKLFKNTYKYRVALKTPLASLFRTSNRSYIPNFDKHLAQGNHKFWFLRQQPEPNVVDHAKRVHALLQEHENDIRVEFYTVQIYTNSQELVEELVKDELFIRDVTIPKNNQDIPEGTIICKRIAHNYKVWFGQLQESHEAFVNWCKQHDDKIRMSYTIKERLIRTRSYQGGYFYVKDEKTLTMVKMMFGQHITKIENIIHDPD